MKESEKKIQIGGQAVIEGVMMRGPEQIATAIRRKDGSIEVQKRPFISVTKTHPIYKKPVIRGFVSLIEMLKIGIQTLNYSAEVWEADNTESGVKSSEFGVRSSEIEYATDESNIEVVAELASDQNPPQHEDTEVIASSLATGTTVGRQSQSEIGTTVGRQNNPNSSKLGEYLTIGVAFILALVLFGYVPYLLTSLLNLEKNNIYFNLFAGSIRIVFFVIYVYCISLMKDIKRVFEYHGAEHKAVFAHESKAPLTIESVRGFTTIHPRCGTSFMFIVLLIAILVFSIVDTFVALYLFTPGPLARFLYHLPFIPIISGISYEFLKLSERKANNLFLRIFTKPGMALQKITTQPPDDEQLEVAIVALKEALNITELEIRE